MYNIFIFILLLSVILNVITMYINFILDVRHPDVHNFIYNCIFVRLLYIFVYIKLDKYIQGISQNVYER